MVKVEKNTLIARHGRLRWIEGAYFEFIQGQLPVGIERLKNLLIILKDCVPPEELQNLFDDVKYFVLDLVKNPLIIFSCRQDAGIFQINEVPGGFGLGKFEDVFQVGDAHFSVHHDQIKDAEPGSVRTG
jgi:hypothetical protein